MCECLSFIIPQKTTPYSVQNQNQQRVRRDLPARATGNKFHELTILFNGSNGIVELEVDGISVCMS